MIDQDYAAIAAAQDFSNGIAVWRASHAGTSPAVKAPAFKARALIPIMVVSILTLVDCALLSFALLPSVSL